jgi:hypothetical protein
VTLVFLDIDGTLVPFGRTSPAGKPADGGNPLLSRVDLRLARRLATLPAQLVWATTWMHEANDLLAAHLGWPPLPVLEVVEPSIEDEYFKLHWKTRSIVAHAAGRAFAWVDDEITDADQEWVDEHHAGVALLLRVDSRAGLTSADLGRLASWIGTRGRDR